MGFLPLWGSAALLLAKGEDMPDGRDVLIMVLVVIVTLKLLKHVPEVQVWVNE